MNLPISPRSVRATDESRVNIDLALLRTFVAVVDLGSVARAAERVFRSQPAASLQLKRLEQITGTQLFRKNGRGLSLTDGGDILLGYARRLLDLHDETVSAVATLQLAGSIRLGISQDFADGWLSSVLARFARAHPSIAIEVKADRNAVLREALVRRQLDFALMFGEKDGAKSTDLGRIAPIWIGTNECSWKGAETVPLVAFEPPCEFRRIGVKALDDARRKWRVAFSSPSLSSQWSAVEAGLGVTVRTAIGLRPPLVALGKQHGLPALPGLDMRLLLFRADKLEAPSRKLEEILIETIRERL